MHSSKKAKAKIEPAGCNCDIVECETIEGYREHYLTLFVRVRQQQQQRLDSKQKIKRHDRGRIKENER
jgi:hypothetical protein